jgi:hypothetical protein
MAKRSREDFEPSSSDSEPATVKASPSSALSVIQPDSKSSSCQSSKIAHLEIGGEAPLVTVMRCSLPPHRQTLFFTSYEDYEVHDNKAHMNRCVECRKNFPTEHFLNLHIEENHDALVGVRKDRGERTVSQRLPQCTVADVYFHY